jgi:hypothetical protein
LFIVAIGNNRIPQEITFRKLGAIKLRCIGKVYGSSELATGIVNVELYNMNPLNCNLQSHIEIENY